MVPTFSLLQERIFLTLSNYIFTAVFLAEMTVKVSEEAQHRCGPSSLQGVWREGNWEGVGRLATVEGRVGWGLQGEWPAPMTWWWFPGGGPGLVLWGAGLPAQQLECAGWLAGAHLRHRHPGIHGLRQWHQDPWHAEGAAAAADPTPTQVIPPPPTFNNL